MNNRDKKISSKARKNNNLVTPSKKEKVCFNGKINKKLMKMIYKKTRTLLILNQKQKR